MAAHFYPLKIKSVERETQDCVVVTFDIPPSLKETFHYKHGQHLTIRTAIKGQEIRRNYSLCSSPLDEEWRIAVKRVEGGLFSTHAYGMLRAGDVLDVMPPMGKFFTLLNANASKHYVAIAAGSGITPVLSIIKTTLQAEPNSRFTLVYANRNRASIIFREELEALKNNFIRRFALHHMLSREKTGAAIYEGRVDAEKCELIFTKLVNLKTVDECFICGPAGMIETVRHYLESRGYDKHKIHFELFNAAGTQPRIPMQPSSKTVAPGAASTVTIKLDGHHTSFKLPTESDSILDAALKQGADLPYACKGGVCCTCKARLREGEVTMDVNFGLEDEEVAAGYILTCQSHPLTPHVFVDFDDR